MLLCLSGIAAPLASAHAATLNAEAAYCRAAPAPPVASFSLPAVPRPGLPRLGDPPLGDPRWGDPWASGGAACGPGVSGPWTRSGPVPAWRPRRLPAVTRPRPPVPIAPVAIAAMPLAPMPLVSGGGGKPAAVCGPVARDIPLAAGGAVFNVLTAGAAPNTPVTLRIDNRTTVTITVNAAPAGAEACVSTIADAGPFPALAEAGTSEARALSLSGPGDDPPRGGDGLLDTGFLTALHAPPAFLISGPGSVQASTPAAAQGSGGTAVMEPSSLLLLGSGVIGLRWLARRRRSR